MIIIMLRVQLLLIMTIDIVTCGVIVGYLGRNIADCI